MLCEPRGDHEDRSDKDHEDGVKLAVGESHDAMGTRVRLADTFEGDADEGVKDEKDPGQDAMRELGVTDAEEDQQGAEKESLAEGFVELGGMPGVEDLSQFFTTTARLLKKGDDVGAVDCAGRQRDDFASLAEEVLVMEFAGEFHGPGDVRDPSKEFAIDEVGDASEKDPHGCSADEGVANTHPRNLVPPGIPQAKESHSGDASMTGHAALVDEK